MGTACFAILGYNRLILHLMPLFDIIFAKDGRRQTARNVSSDFQNFFLCLGTYNHPIQQTS